MVATGEVSKYEAAAVGGDSNLFLGCTICLCGLQGQEVWCIVVVFLLSIFIQKNT
jgi:hypothetical protein